MIVLAQTGAPDGDVVNHQERMVRIIQHHWHEPAMPVAAFVFAALGVLLIVGALALLRWHRRRHERPAPLLTFHRIADELGLSLTDQWLLLRIARSQRLATPLALMLSGGTLRHHGQAFAAARRDDRRTALLRRLDDLHGRLFADGTGRPAP